MTYRLPIIYIAFMLCSYPLFAQQSSIKYIQPRENFTIVSKPDFQLQVGLPGVKSIRKVSVMHNDMPVRYSLSTKSGKLTARLKLETGNNLILIKNKRKTERIVIQYKPNKKPNSKPGKASMPKITLGKKKPGKPSVKPDKVTVPTKPTPRPKPSQPKDDKAEEITLEDLAPNAETFSTTDKIFPIEGAISGVDNRQQILLVHNKKEITNYNFRNGTIKARIQLEEGMNDIILAAENKDGTDVLRWKITRLKGGAAEEPATAGQELKMRNGIIAYAKKYKGTPYTYGGSTPKSFDCSGFTAYILDEYGVKLPRRSLEQAKEGKKVRQKRAQAGDLAFFAKNGREVSHVSLIVKSSEKELLVIHSTSSRGVIIEDIMKSTYWLPKMLYIKDVISN